MITVRYKILEGENFGEMAHCNNWRIIFWRMPKSSQKSKASKKMKFQRIAWKKWHLPEINSEVLNNYFIHSHSQFVAIIMKS